MKKKDKVLINLIHNVASDDRSRVLVEDNDRWLETKLSEIKRLSELISCYPFKPIDWDSKLVKEAMKDSVDGSGGSSKCQR